MPASSAVAARWRWAACTRSSGLQAFQQARSQTSFISTGTPHKVLLSFFTLFLPNGLVRTVLAILAWVGLIVVAILLTQVFPKSLVPQTHPDDPTPAAIRYTAIYAIAWILTAMYSLPWYDLIAWVALAAVAASKVDGLMVVRTTMLAIAYVPGRDPNARQVAASLSDSLEWFSARLRDTICPAIELAVLIGLIVWARRSGAQWWPYDWPRRKTKSRVRRRPASPLISSDVEKLVGAGVFVAPSSRTTTWNSSGTSRSPWAPTRSHPAARSRPWPIAGPVSRW